MIESDVNPLQESKAEENNTIPEYLLERIKCPLTYSIFKDPVTVDGCGHAFERNAIAQCTRCPSCRKPVISVSPAYLIKDLTEDLVRRFNLHDEVFSPPIIPFQPEPIPPMPAALNNFRQDGHSSILLSLSFLLLLASYFIQDQDPILNDENWYEEDFETFKAICNSTYYFSNKIDSKNIDYLMDAQKSSYSHYNWKRWTQCPDIGYCPNTTEVPEIRIYNNILKQTFYDLERLLYLRLDALKDPLSFTVVSLLKQDKKEDSKFKIHRIDAGIVEQHGFFVTNEISKMKYLLVNSDIPIQIHGYHTGIWDIHHVFAQIQKGKICDPTYSYYGDYAFNYRVRYNLNNEFLLVTLWDFLTKKYLSVKDYSDYLSFPHFEKLSRPAQEFVCNEVRKLDFEIKPRSRCRLFDNPIGNIVSNETLSLEQNQQESHSFKPRKF